MFFFAIWCVIWSSPKAGAEESLFSVVRALDVAVKPCGSRSVQSCWAAAICWQSCWVCSRFAVACADARDVAGGRVGCAAARLSARVCVWASCAVWCAAWSRGQSAGKVADSCAAGRSLWLCALVVVRVSTSFIGWERASEMRVVCSVQLGHVGVGGREKHCCETPPLRAAVREPLFLGWLGHGLAGGAAGCARCGGQRAAITHSARASRPRAMRTQIWLFTAFFRRGDDGAPGVRPD